MLLMETDQDCKLTYDWRKLQGMKTETFSLFEQFREEPQTMVEKNPPWFGEKNKSLSGTKRKIRSYHPLCKNRFSLGSCSHLDLFEPSVDILPLGLGKVIPVPLFLRGRKHALYLTHLQTGRRSRLPVTRSRTLITHKSEVTVIKVTCELFRS